MIKENAEPTGPDILHNKKEKGTDISSATENSIPDLGEKVNTSDKKIFGEPWRFSDIRHSDTGLCRNDKFYFYYFKFE